MKPEEYKNMDAIENSHFWFTAKRKFINIVLNKYAKDRNLKILDVGCGTGAIIKFLETNDHDACGVDANIDALNYCFEKGLNVKKSSAEKINFEDNEFDAVLALDLLEHLDNPENAIKEMKRVLKKNGILIATVPAHQFLWCQYHDGNLHHKKRYGKNDFKSLFQNDFKIEKLSWIHSSILLPAILGRTISKQSHKKNSDVEECGKAVNSIMNIVYFFELSIFKIFNRLPWGLSLLVVAKK